CRYSAGLCVFSGAVAMVAAASFEPQRAEAPARAGRGHESPAVLAVSVGAGSSGRAGSIARTSTIAVPLGQTPSFTAATYERSITRLATNGPRSLMRTTTLRPFSRFVTRA